MARKSKLFEKPEWRSEKHTKDDRDSGHAVLRNYGGAGGTVEMFWGWNEESTEDQIFRLRVNGVDVYLDWEEFQKSARWI